MVETTFGQRIQSHFVPEGMRLARTQEPPWCCQRSPRPRNRRPLRSPQRRAGETSWCLPFLIPLRVPSEGPWQKLRRSTNAAGARSGQIERSHSNLDPEVFRSCPLPVKPVWGDSFTLSTPVDEGSLYVKYGGTSIKTKGQTSQFLSRRMAATRNSSGRELNGVPSREIRTPRWSSRRCEVVSVTSGPCSSAQEVRHGAGAYECCRVPQSKTTCSRVAKGCPPWSQCPHGRVLQSEIVHVPSDAGRT